MSDTSYDPDAVLADPFAHPKHVAIALINKRVRDHGERWAKCANCGDPYQVADGMSYTVCSDQCDREFAASLTEGW